MAAEQSKYWFRTKRYGWGWGVPARWQGWVVLFSFVIVLIGSIYFLLLPYENTELPLANALAFFAILTIDVSVMLWLTYKHGEPPRWRLRR